MKIALAQINTTAGDVPGNLSGIIGGIARAKAAGADLVAFPELSVSGWLPGDLLHERSFRSACDAALDQVAREADGIAVVLGHPSFEADRAFRSSASLLKDGCVAARADGSRLGAVDVWERCAEPPAVAVAPPCNVAGRQVAWCVDSFPRVAEGADVIVALWAAPFYRGCAAMRETMLSGAAGGLDAPVAWVNLVGGNGTTVFDGGSAVAGSDGRLLARAGRSSEDLLVVDLEGRPQATPASEAQTETADVYEALRLGLADYVRKSGFRDVVLGLSGGIDSALVAAIAADALGPTHVTALGMPSAYSSDTTRSLAEEVARNLGINYCVVPIEDLRAAFDRAVAPLFAGSRVDTTEENIQARVRGTLVMAFANKFHAMALATGNRSELAVGYCTLYGDTAGGLAPIGDVPKTAVYELARHVNRNGEVIPSGILRLCPSAELKPGQTDQDVLPPYEVLDEILRLYLDERADPEDVVHRGFEPGVVADVVARVKGAAFKRRQVPPALRVWSSGCVWPEFPTAGRMVAEQGGE